MMDIRVVRVRMNEGCMDVLMRVRAPGVPREVMGMLVMFVMHVAVGVFQRRVRMQVHVTLGDMQPHAQRHEGARQPEAGRGHFVQ